MQTHDYDSTLPQQRSRQTVVKWSGSAIATIALAGGVLPNFGISPALAADLGAGDVGILN